MGAGYVAITRSSMQQSRRNDMSPQEHNTPSWDGSMSHEGGAPPIRPPPLVRWSQQLRPSSPNLLKSQRTRETRKLRQHCRPSLSVLRILTLLPPPPRPPPAGQRHPN